MKLLGIKQKPVSVDQALIDAEHDVEERKTAVAEAKDKIKDAQKEAKTEQKALTLKEKQTKAAKRFGELAADPAKAYKKVRRDKWTRRFAATAAAATALSLTTQFTDIDERAKEYLQDKYEGIMETISGLATEASATTPDVFTAPAGTFTTRPQGKPANFAEIVQDIKAAQRNNAITAALEEILPTGPGGS